MVIEQVNTTNTLIRVKMQQLKCFIICPAQQPSNMGIVCYGNKTQRGGCISSRLLATPHIEEGLNFSRPLF